jgi:predicted ATPase
MLLYARQDQRSRALEHYARWQQTLQAELAAEPEPATQELADRLRAGELADASTGPVVVLPHYGTRFFGREPELAQLAHMLEDRSHPVIVLVGVGGVGKTRLAVQAAAAQAHLFPDGVFFVACAGLQQPDFLVQAIAQAVGCTFEGARDPRHQLLHFLRQRAALLLIDNLEQVLAGAGLLAELVRRAPDIALLVTSREQPDVPGAQVFPVAGLATAEADDPAQQHAAAVQLFLDRARHAQLQVALQPSDLPAIQHVCSHVEGMPLGIELAAGWIRYLSCADIADELTQSLDLLATTQRDGDWRHQSMRVVIEQSWRLLEAADQEVLARLALFRGSFSQEAAAAVAGARPEHLEEFISKSWLRQYATGRYTMHELLRQYAEEQLHETGEFAEVCDRHLRFYTGIAEYFGGKITTADQVTAFHQIDLDLANIRAALTWSQTDVKRIEAGIRILAATFFYWYFRTLWSECRGWAKKIIAYPGIDQQSVAWAHVLLVAGKFAWLQRDIETARGYLIESIALLRNHSSDSGLAYSLTFLGYTLLYKGNTTSAEEAVQEGIALFRNQGDTWGLVVALTALGEIVTQHGQFVLAQECYQEALDMLNQVAYPYIHTRRSRLFRYQGDYVRSRSESELVITIAQQLGVERFKALALENLGLVSNAQNEPVQAIYTLAESIIIYNEVGDQAGVAACIEGIAAAQVLLANAPLAAWLLGAAEALRTTIEVPIPPVDRIDHERTMSTIGTLIDKATYDSAWRMGRITPIEQVIAVITGADRAPTL